MNLHRIELVSLSLFNLVARTGVISKGAELAQIGAAGNPARRGAPTAFNIDPSRKQRLLHGIDDIGHTLARADRIRECDSRRRELEPWLFS